MNSGQLYLFCDENNPTKSEIFLLEEGNTYVGSDNSCKIKINGEGIANKHMKIILSDLEIRIEDLGSQIGTFREKNEKKIKLKPKKEYELDENQPIFIGKFKIIIKLNQSPKNINIIDLEAPTLIDIPDEVNNINESSKFISTLDNNIQFSDQIEPSSISNNHVNNGQVALIIQDGESLSIVSDQNNNIKSTKTPQILIDNHAINETNTHHSQTLKNGNNDPHNFVLTEVIDDEKCDDKYCEKSKLPSKKQNEINNIEATNLNESTNGKTIAIEIFDKKEKSSVQKTVNEVDDLLWINDKIESNGNKKNNLVQKKLFFSQYKPQSILANISESDKAKINKIIDSEIIKNSIEVSCNTSDKKLSIDKNCGFDEKKKDDEDKAKNQKGINTSDITNIQKEKSKKKKQMDTSTRQNKEGLEQNEESKSNGIKNKKKKKKKESTIDEIKDNENVFCNIIDKNQTKLNLVPIKRIKEMKNNEKNEEKSLKKGEEKNLKNGDEKNLKNGKERIIEQEEKINLLGKDHRDAMQEEEKVDNGANKHKNMNSQVEIVNDIEKKVIHERQSLDKEEKLATKSKKIKAVQTDNNKSINEITQVNNSNEENEQMKKGKSVLISNQNQLIEIEEEKKSDINLEKDLKEDESVPINTNNNAKNVSNDFQVTFSGFDSTDQFIDIKNKFSKLGVTLVDDYDKPFNTLVMDRFKRTIKFLHAVNQGINIVSINWVKDCIKCGYIISKLNNYEYYDKKSEDFYQYNLANSLKIARNSIIIKKKFLEGWNVYIPQNINISYDEIIYLIKSAGGNPIKNKPIKFVEKLIIIAHYDDDKAIDYFVDLGFTVYNLEIILTGCLNQKLDFMKNILGKP